MIVCGIASVPLRESGLKMILDSISPQVNVVYVSLNGYAKIPDWQDQFSNVYFTLTDNSNGDAEKFRYADKVGSCYYVAWDDDLQCPDKGVEYLLKGVDRYNGLASLHGKTYLAPVIKFREFAMAYRVLGNVTEDIRTVNVIGSGCCAFHTDRLSVSMADFKEKNMSDIWLSKLCYDQQVPMVVLAHARGYVQYLRPPPGTTIWETTSSYESHVRVMRKFIK